jgi:hypothetical protein
MEVHARGKGHCSNSQVEDNMEEIQEELDELLPVLEREAQCPDPSPMIPMALGALTELREEMAAGQISSESLDEYAYGLWRNLVEDLPWTKYGLGRDLMNFTATLHRVANKLK